jgi:hypothetical protein
MQGKMKQDALQNPSAFPCIERRYFLQQHTRLGLERGNSDISSMLTNFVDLGVMGFNVDYYS